MSPGRERCVNSPSPRGCGVEDDPRLGDPEPTPSAVSVSVVKAKAGRCALTLDFLV